MRAALLSTMVGLSAVVAAGALTHSFGAFGAKRHVFSQEAWHEHKPLIEQTADPGCVLGPMAQDLIQTRQLQGVAATQARQLLGEPSNQSASALVYAIGQCHGWGWHAGELVLTLSPSQVIIGASVRRAEKVS
jgi:hypothetical protein